MTVCALAAAASIHFEAADRVIDGARRHEPLNLNGLLAILLLVPIATTIYAVRRYRDAMAVRAELARLSLRDDLTGLPNRLFLSEWIDREMKTVHRAGARVGLLFVDLDRFKVINDTHGHDVGDALRVAASVGVAVSEPHETGEELIRRADAAMYDAKVRDDGRRLLRRVGPRAPLQPRDPRAPPAQGGRGEELPPRLPTGRRHRFRPDGRRRDAVALGPP